MTQKLAVPALVLALVAAQAWCTSVTTTRVYYEELAESVRNPFWIAHGLVYDGVSGNVGWYGLLAGVYGFFGFSLIAGKVLRLAFHALSLACLAHLLVQWLGVRRSLVPIAVIGSSPVLLYFNTLLTTYGVDLQWAPVIVWLLGQSIAPAAWRRAAVHAALGLSVMIACLMWPVCVFYVPGWILGYVVRWRVAGERIQTASVTIAVLSAAVPIALTTAYLQNARTWIHDPSSGSGIFRGGGAGLVDSPRVFAAHVWWLIRDVTVSGTSYYFWLPRPDLSGVVALLSLCGLLAMVPALRRAGRRIWMAALACVAFAGATGGLAAAVSGPPGLRRATTAIAAFYTLYVLCWHVASAEARRRPGAWVPKVQLGLLSLLLLHHAIVLVPNGLSLQRERPPVERTWFGVAETPQESIEYWAGEIEEGRALDCRLVSLGPELCRYAEIYAAVASHLRWSRGRAVAIDAFDPVTDGFVRLSPEAWPDHLRH